jgi:hypothetical protein
MISVWDWVYEFQDKMYESGDTERMRLWRLFTISPTPLGSDPDRALALFEEGRALARQLGEPWWAMFFEHWRLQVLLHFKGDYRAALQSAVPVAVEARKQRYVQLPQRLCIHEDLITAYVGIDPIGHAERIRHALNYMEEEVSPDLECYKCLQELRTAFELAQEHLDAAEAAAMQNLATSQDEPHYLSQAYANLCRIAHRRGDNEALRRWAEVGESTARMAMKPREAVECLAWQALARRREGDEAAATRLYRRAKAGAARLGSPPEEHYYEALATYHHHGGRPDLALKIRERQIKELLGKGQTAVECECRLALCRLLSELGRPVDAAVDAARSVAQDLIDPTPVLAELDRLQRQAST